jgi:two-component system sensor histidine kinase SenX3
VNKRMGLLYGLLIALIVVMGVWWVYYLTEQGRAQAEHELQKLANDRLHAAFLIQSDPQVRAEPERWLGEAFPHLVFRRTSRGIEVEVRPERIFEIEREAAATRNMFIYEGVFFFALLVSGVVILIFSWRSEVRFKQARELFLAAATHEFKTPLASLRLYAETLGREGLKDEARQRIHTRMVDDVGRLESLVDDMLAMSAGDTFAKGPRVTMDLAAECCEVLDDLRPFATAHRAELVCAGEPGATIAGQRLFLSLALRNLVVNAIMHGPEGVRVEVTVEPGDRWHQVAVKDNGPGIPRRLHEKIFECFYSTTRGAHRGGTGLGLYLVKRNAEDLGGRVEIDSEEGQGSTFRLVLPAASSDS